jgi:hypothetical protein
MSTTIKPKVSICVAYFNRSEHIKESIGSLLTQTYENYEVVVVNDGSPDPLVKVLLDQFNDVRLKVIHQQNKGFVGAMTTAIANSDGDFIAIHGAGDISRNQRIKEQAEFLAKNDDYALVSCHYTDVVVDDAGKGTETPFKLSAGEIIEDDLTYGPSPIGHGEVMYRRSAYEKAGGYREFFKFAQDKDLWLRMIYHGRFYILPINLYERGLFMKDGIATNHDKLYVQKLLIAFALQCYEYKKLHTEDLIDIYGARAGLFRTKSKKVANFCHTTSFRFLMKNEFSNALKFNQLSILEVKMIKNRLFNYVLFFCKNRIIRKLVIASLIFIKVIKQRVYNRSLPQ